MNLVITLTTAGTDTGPFNIYSDVDGYVSAFETNISKADLLAGFATANVPDGTVEIRVRSVNDLCNNYASAGTVALTYYFESQADSFMIYFIDKTSYAYVYGYYTGYYNGSYTVPGNHIIKLQSDFSVDTSFDIGEGFGFHNVYTNTTFYEQSDGKIIITGYFTTYNGATANRIIRLNTDGSRDTTFNIGTGFDDYSLAVVEDNSGRFVITGRYGTYNGATSPRLIRLLNDGSKDTSFNVGVGFNNATISILINDDDSMIVSHYSATYKGVSIPTGIVKINSDASLNTIFNTTVGTGFNSGNNNPIDFERLPGDSHIYCGGYFTSFNSNPCGGIARIDNDGNFDATFNSGGVGFLPERRVYFIKIIWGEKLLVAGNGLTSYNGVSTGDYIILNLDGTIFLNFYPISYTTMYTIGNNLYGQVVGGVTELVYTYTP